MAGSEMSFWTAPLTRHPSTATLTRDSLDQREGCPLLALSGHQFRRQTCLLLGVKRTSAKRDAMSANDPERTLPTFQIGQVVMPKDAVRRNPAADRRTAATVAATPA